MEFKCLRKEARIATASGVQTHTIEYRWDPLTGTVSRINLARTGRPRQTALASAERPEGGICPFCPENLDRMTPVLPPELGGGRITGDTAVLFPNLYPLARYHAVALFSTEHSLELPEFTSRLIADNLGTALEFISRVFKHEPATRYPLYFWNHLPPSAASIIHPHSQILVEDRPTTYQRMLLKAAYQYFKRTGENYWEVLLREEKGRGERFIGELGRVAVLAVFAPQGNREVLFIPDSGSSLLDLDGTQIEDLASALSRTLQGYHRMGIDSFNVSAFSGPMGKPLPYFRLHFKLISRPRFAPYYRNDTGPLEKFHYESDIEMTPETLCRELRPLFLA